MIAFAQTGYLTIGCCELLLLCILFVAQHENEFSALTWSKVKLNIMTGDRAPSVSQTIGRLSVKDGLWLGEIIVQTEKRLTIGIISLYRAIHRIVCVMITTLLILRFMIERRESSMLLYLHFASREIALEILTISSGIP